MSIMLNELLSQPEVLTACLTQNRKTIKEIAETIKRENVSHIVTMARGTSYNAAICFKYAMELMTGIPVVTYTPSLTTVYKGGLNYKNGILFAISQSGMGADTLEVVESAKAKGCKIVGITNNKDSLLASRSDYHIHLAAGEEKSVAATKTFAAQLCALYMIVSEVSGNSSIIKDIEKIGPKLEEIKKLGDAIDHAAKEVKDAAQFIIISRGLTMGIADEAGLKMKECCYKYTVSYSSSEFIHGPLALVDENTRVILIAPSGECSNDFINIATRLNLLGAKIVAFSDIKDVLNISDLKIKMPRCTKWDADFAYVMAVQLFAESMSVRLGLNPDNPRNLQKVTITR
ncbi:MAG: SIS domain-containing protein [Clostridiales bacterium]|jgi:glucosamine--fructose-6-phosphate aminotransferase (isomerizing)|nr:SIS domain-containing protein [Clostridiales bacterium]